MFERYTEEARRTIFFARYEASRFGTPYIETEHLLLGLMREDRPTLAKLLSDEQIDQMQRDIETRPHSKPISTSVDLPLSDESKRALAFGAEEAQALEDPKIRPGHLLLGLLREGRGLASTLLQQAGLNFNIVRERIASKNSGQ